LGSPTDGGGGAFLRGIGLDLCVDIEAPAKKLKFNDLSIQKT
jgi:hypothetical protein